MKAENVIGQKYNKLTIIEETERHTEPNGKKQRVMICQCECGNKTRVQLKDLRSKRPVKSCGCLNKEHAINIEKENRYGMLTILKEVDSYISPAGHTSRKVLCSCGCGNQKEVKLGSLRAGDVINCGCKPKQRKEKIIPLDLDKVNKKDLGSWKIISEDSVTKTEKGIVRIVTAICSCGYMKHTNLQQVYKGGRECFKCALKRIKNVSTEELERRTVRNNIRTRWVGMKTRCYNTNDKSYNRYGGRGIIICADWLKSFDSFYQWAISNGYKKELQIDRENNDGNYEPGNCRWVTKEVNARNMSTSVVSVEMAKTIVEYSKTMSIKEIMKLTGFSRHNISYTLKHIHIQA